MQTSKTFPQLAQGGKRITAPVVKGASMKKKSAGKKSGGRGC